MKSLLYTSFFFLLFLFSCKSGRIAKKYKPMLYQHWVHSHEEDTEEYRAFRLATFEFPPSRGREGFKINQDGTLMRFGIGPTDIPTEIECTWKAASKSSLVIQPVEGDQPLMTIQIIDISGELLKVAK